MQIFSSKILFPSRLFFSFWNYKFVNKQKKKNSINLNLTFYFEVYFGVKITMKNADNKGHCLSTTFSSWQMTLSSTW